MNRAVVTKSQIAALLGIAGLIASIAAFLICARTAPFYFELSMRSSQTGTTQMYYDTGSGVTELDSTTALLREGESSVRFPLPAGEYKLFRFDPINQGYCQITIHQAKIIDVSGNVVRSFSPEDFTTWRDISERRIANGEIALDLKVGDSDPSLIITLGTPLQLYPSAWSAWLYIFQVFFLCLISIIVVGLCWLLFCPRGWTASAILFLLVAVFVYLFARSRFYAPISFDEEAFIWYGWLVNSGSVPYRDLFEPKPPVIFFANALGLALFGLKGFLFRIVPTTVAVASLLVFYVAMMRRRITPWLTVLLTAQMTLWLFGGDFHDAGLNDSESYGFAFTVLGFSLGSIGSSLERRSGRVALQLLSGICFGLAVLSKELFVFSVIPAWLLAARRSADGGWDWRHLLFSAVGGVAAGLCFLAYLLTHGAFGRYLEVLRFSRTFAANYCVDIGKFPRVSGGSVLLQCWTMLHNKLYNLEHLAFVLPLCAIFLFLIARGGKLTTRLNELAIAGAAVVLGMAAVSVGFCFWKHYFLMGTTGLLLFGVIGAEALSRFLRERRSHVSVIFGAGLLAVFLYVASGPVRVIITEQQRSPIIAWDPLVIETIEKHSKPGDYILATEGPLIYVAMNRRASIPVPSPADDVLPYLGGEHPSLNMEFLRAELEKNLPKVCYFAGWFRDRQKIWHEQLYDPLLVKYHYVPVDGRLWVLPDDARAGVPDELPKGY